MSIPNNFDLRSSPVQALACRNSQIARLFFIFQEEQDNKSPLDIACTFPPRHHVSMLMKVPKTHLQKEDHLRIEKTPCVYE